MTPKYGLIFLVLISPTLFGKDYNVSVARLPLYSESPDKGILIDVIKALDAEYKEGRFIIETYPFKRSIHNVATGKADFHFPTIGSLVWGLETDRFETQLHAEGLQRSTASLVKTHFALYSNSDKPPLDIDHLSRYRIETDAGHTLFFHEDIQGTTCLKCSVEKLSKGRIDGLIFAAREVDVFAEQLGITNLRRQQYQTFGSKFILPLGEKGAEIDQLLTRLIRRMVEKGTLQQVAAPYLEYFQRTFAGDDYYPTLDEIQARDGL